VTIESKVLGRISAPEEYIITFSAGLPGYPQERRYALIDSQLEPPFYLLQCVDNATVVFVVADPTKLFPEYHPKTSPVDLQDLQAQSPEDLRVLTILTIPAGRHREITVNLTSPILINPARRLGKQIVIDKPQYSSQYPLTAGNPRPNPKRNDDRENKTS
ncbi:MAG TPA: flagellar assembly protein FliW, partial [Desulfobaccales bacterium]|nr:flagellar assembly protein FliW [Desulfobaccales bacterium]